ncbi:MAG: baseplate J/gp47 family protein [Patescibacteria group bacterium]
MDEKNQNKNTEKRSIRNIPLTKKQTKELEKIEEEMAEGVLPPPPLMTPPPRPISRQAVAKKAQKSMEEEIEIEKKSSRRGNLFWWAVAAVCLLLIYGIAHYFRHATVTIVRAEETVVLSDNNFGLAMASSSIQIPAGVITYQKSIFNISTSTSISATGEQRVEKKAVGKIVVYNDSTTSQLLIATTRFQSTDGLIFRLNKNVTIPAKKNLTVDVTADQAGEKYNIGPRTFSLPALAGTAKAKTVYGKSSVSMAGGLISNVPKASSGDLSTAKALLQNNLREEAVRRALSEVPEGYIFVEGALVVTFDDIVQSYTAVSKSATLSQSASVGVYYLDKHSFGVAVASQGSLLALSTVDVAADTVSLVATIPAVKTADKMILTGTSTVKVIFAPEEIAGKLAGLSRNEALAAIKALPGVEIVQISLKPWWEHRLPSKEAIAVEIE